MILSQDISKFASKWVTNMHKNLSKYYGVSDDKKFFEEMRKQPDVYGLTYTSYLIYERFE